MSVHRLKVVDPAVKWKVKPKRAKPYGGKRQALTQDELDRLFAALKGNRHGHRDYMVALDVPARSQGERTDRPALGSTGARAPSPSGASRARSTAPITLSATRPLG